MKKTYIKNLSFICLIMILIHLAGLTYQFITKASILAISLKIFYIAMFTLFLFSLIKNKKFSYLIGIISSVIIIIISAMYMDFLSIVISVLVIFYSYNLKSCIHDDSIRKSAKTKKVYTKNIHKKK